jgi:hypothetical protein
VKRLTGFLGELAGSPTGEFAGATRFFSSSLARTFARSTPARSTPHVAAT